MKHLYKYKVEDRTEPFKALAGRRNNIETKEITYRLSYNNTSIKPAEKCSLCREKTSEMHIFTECKRVQEIKKDLNQGV